MDNTRKTLSEIKKVLRETKAIDPIALDLKPYQTYCDYVIIATGSSNRHVEAMSERIQSALKERLGRRPLGVEGDNACDWILLDYGEVIVHLFQEDLRYAYHIEGVWPEAKKTAIRMGKVNEVSGCALRLKPLKSNLIFF